MSGLMRSFLAQGKRLVQAVTRKRHVGVDLHGNDYFLHQEYPDQPARRVVQYKDATPDLASVPMLWHTWLRGHRDQPPSLDELRADEQRLSALQQRVAALRLADSKLRVQELAERRMSGRSEADSDMSAEGMLRELETQRDEDVRWSGRSTKRGGDG